MTGYIVYYNGIQSWHGSHTNCLRYIGVAVKGPKEWRKATLAEAIKQGYQLRRN